MTQFSIDRRSFFNGAGALVVSIGIPGGVSAAQIGSGVKPPLSPDRLDSWLGVKADGDVVAYFGKMHMGQGGRCRDRPDRRDCYRGAEEGLLSSTRR